MRLGRRNSRKLRQLFDIYTEEAERYMQSAGVELNDSVVEDFIKWRATDEWSRFKQAVMDKELIIRNKIDSLDLRLPNAKKGMPYKTSLTLAADLADSFTLEGLEGSGLTVERSGDDTYAIYGTPEIANNYTVILKYHCAGCSPERGNYSKEIQLTVNPDPRDLWKNIATPTYIEYYKPDHDTGYVKAEAVDGKPQKDIVAASQRGRSHAHEGRPRDDDFSISFNNTTGWYVIAVADGAGSAKYSRRGSKIAVDTAVGNCNSILENPAEFEKAINNYHLGINDETNRKAVSDYIYRIVGTAAFRANRAIHEFQELNNPESTIKDFSTTLLLAICKKFDFGWFVASFWVGDGAMAIYGRENRYLKVLGQPDGGEYAGQTRFLTMDSIFANPADIMKRLRFSIESDFTALMLMSDGVSDAKFETDANLNRIEKWDDLWNEITSHVDLSDDNENSQAELLKWLDFWSPGNHDDRTIAILY